ncbi:ARM repeat-containing protein [Xylariaceae sp. FL1651]|nr:ARM repeat-containing protein [Xylariaceae sp. FL1651]
MTTATRSNGFPTLAMAGSNNKNTQSLGSFSSSTWQPNGIWGNIGSSLNSHRDTAGSRGSDELSPTAPSGSAQLNPLSEPAPWAPRGIWPQRNTNSSNVSPTRTKDSFPYNIYESANASNIFPLRQSISQGTSSLQNRTVPPGPVESPTSTLRYGSAVGGLVGEERGNSGVYGAPGASQLGLDSSGSHRRNSADPSYLSLGHSRPGTYIGRQPEPDTSALPSRFGESSVYPFTKGPVHSKPLNQRPSISNVSVTLPPEATRGQVFTFPNNGNHSDLNETLDRALTLEDSAESGNGYTSNGYLNPTSQPFQFDPSSQSWQNDMSNGTRNFGQGMQHDSWTEPSNTSYHGGKRGSVERSSPAGSSYRPNVNSPRTFSGTPNLRTDPWNRPGSRNPSVPQDLDRQQGSQFSHQPAGFYHSPYYNSHLPQFSAPYEQYTQPPNYRSQMPVPGYGLPVNYMTVPIRTTRDQDPSKGVRSMLLDEFRSNTKSNKRYELKDIYNHIVEFSGDQHGSRFIQDKLQTANSEEKEHVFREIEPNALQLMKDVFGNYVIQKFFEHGNQVQKKIIAAQMKGKVAELSIQMYSCRVVQKALEHVLVEQQTEIVEELRPDIMKIVKDQNGNHVVQKVIQMVPRLCIPFIMDAFRGQIEPLASHNYGCRVIQRILEHGTDAERKSLMIDLHSCATKLIMDQYGNYVTQHIIAHGEPEDRSIMIRHVIDRLLLLSKHKFASNVVEKCIEFGTVEERRAIRIKLTAMNGDGTSPLQLMMKDQFGNYVVQKMMQYLDGPERQSFVDEMRPQFATLKKQGTGRQITAIDRLISATASVPGVPNETNGPHGGTATAGTAPSTPSLLVEVSSAVPTPSLTTEQSSPQSTSPPSTNISTTDEAAEEKKAQISRLDKVLPPVRVEEN